MRRLASRCSFALALAAGACASTDGLSGGRRDAGSGPADASPIGADARADASPIGDAAATDATSPADADADADARPTTPPPGCNGSVPGLLGYWRMDEGSGTTVSDCSGNGLDGTLANGNWTTGRFGGGLQLTGDGVVDLQNPSKLQLSGAVAITIAAWVNIANFSGNGRILSKGGTIGDRGWELNVEDTGIAVMRVSPNGNDGPEADSPVLPTNTWLHLAGTYDPNIALKIYVNGVLAGTNTASPASMRNSPQPANIGARADPCCGWKGVLDEVRLYTRVLTAAEIAELAR